MKDIGLILKVVLHDLLIHLQINVTVVFQCFLSFIADGLWAVVVMLMCAMMIIGIDFDVHTLNLLFGYS